MPKVLVEKNLSPISFANNVGRPKYDGVLQKDGRFYLTTCHGNVFGNLGMQTNNIWVDVCPENIREHIRYLLSVDIGKDSDIVIFPCFPREVRKKYKDRLRKNRIVVGCNNWNGKTGITFYDDSFVKVYDISQPKDSVSLIISRADYLLKRYSLGLLQGDIGL